MDTAGLERSFGSRGGWDTWAGAIWHTNEGNTSGKTGLLAWWREGKGVSCRVSFPRALGSHLLLSSLHPCPPETSALGRLLGHSLCWATASAGWAPQPGLE